MNTFGGSGQVKFAPGNEDASNAAFAPDLGAGSPSFAAGKGDQGGASSATWDQRVATFLGAQTLATDAYLDPINEGFVRFSWDSGTESNFGYTRPIFDAYCAADPQTRRRLIEEHSGYNKSDFVRFRTFFDSIQRAMDRLCERVSEAQRRYPGTPGPMSSAHESEQRYMGELGRVYPLVPVAPTYVINRGSVVQIDLPALGQTRTVRTADFLSQFCGLDTKGRWWWVLRLFGIDAHIESGSPVEREITQAVEQLGRLCPDLARQIAAEFGNARGSAQPVVPGNNVQERPLILNRYVVDRGSVVQIDWRGQTRTLRREDFLGQYCRLSANDRVAWVFRLFGFAPEAAVDLQTIDQVWRGLVPELNRLCFARAVAPDLRIDARDQTKPSGQAAPPGAPTDAGLPEWAKYLIGGVVGAGVGYGIFTFTSDRPRANRGWRHR